VRDAREENRLTVTSAEGETHPSVWYMLGTGNRALYLIMEDNMNDNETTTQAPVQEPATQAEPDSMAVLTENFMARIKELEAETAKQAEQLKDRDNTITMLLNGQNANQQRNASMERLNRYLRK